MSGAVFNNSATVDSVSTMGRAIVGWSNFTEGSTGNVFMTHDGAGDTCSKAVLKAIKFGHAVQTDIPLRMDASHTVIDGPNSGGHANHPSLSSMHFKDLFGNIGMAVQAPTGKMDYLQPYRVSAAFGELILET